MTIDSRRYVWCIPPELSETCDAPGCTSTFRLQKHHIVRRSATGGPLDYITIDGLVVQNVCMLCREHHAQVTGLIGGHKAFIKWWDDSRWVWLKKENSEWIFGGLLGGGKY